jgi:hypothetical protein
LQAIAKRYGMLIFVVTMWWRTRKVRKMWSNGSPDVPNHLNSRISRWTDNAILAIFFVTAIGLCGVLLAYLFTTLHQGE